MNEIYYAGVDLGGTRIKCGIVNGAGALLSKVNVPTEREKGAAAVAENMAEAVRLAAREASISAEDIEAVGVGSPGTVDSAAGVIVYSNNLVWHNEPVARRIADALNKPVFVVNDANAAALGESEFGAGKNYRSIVLVTLGTGVGGGIVFDGVLFEGNRSAGAEIGHHVLRAGGERCSCGRRGCFEAYASATALIRDTSRAMERHPESKLWQICAPREVNGESAFLAAKEGDRVAKRVVARYISMLAEGIANLSNIFRPEAILLGGGVCAEGETLLRPLRKKLEKMLYGGMDFAPVEICIASLGNDAGIYGAAAYARAKSGRPRAVRAQ